MLQADVCDIDAPDHIGFRYCQVSRQLGVDLLFPSLLAEVGAGMDGGDTHFAHVSLDMFAIDGVSLAT